VRWDMNTDTPLPPDEPAGQNPPDGAIINYYLGAAISGPVTLEILDSAGQLVRRYSSADPVEPIDPMLAVPQYWARPPRGLSAEAGMHRWLWDLHYTSLPQPRAQLPMTAIVHDTVAAPASPWVMPGRYTAKLTANGQSYTQPLTVKMDPRVHTPLAALTQQFTLSKQCYDDVLTTSKIMEEVRAMRERLKSAPDAALEQKLNAIAGAPSGGGRGGGGGGRGPVAGGPETLASVSAALGQLMRAIENADVAPTTQMAAAVADRHAALRKLMTRWTELKPR